MTEYRNAFHEPGKDWSGPPVYRHDKNPCLEYRGFKVYKLFDRAYDYVYDGVCITQRGGLSKHVIDNVIENTDSDDSRYYIAPAAREHLQANCDRGGA